MDAATIQNTLSANAVVSVDRVVDLRPHNLIVAIKNVSMADPAFQKSAHHPLQLPHTGVIEAMIQTGTILLLKDPDFLGKPIHFSAIESLKFQHSAVPGDQLRMEIKIDAIQEDQIRLTARSSVESKTICEGTLCFTVEMNSHAPQIHPTAFVHPSAKLGKNVIVGPNSTIREDVTIGDGSNIGGHVLIDKWTVIGKDCDIHFGSVIGSAPQDNKYKGEKSAVVMGDRNEVREYVTINRSTGEDTITEIGSDNTILTSAHIAHNCKLGNHIVIANQTNVAGHVVIEDEANIGGMTGIHQFIRIGRGAMVGAYTRLPQDVPPYMLCEGNPATIRGLNLVGLKRKGTEKTILSELKSIHKIVYRSDKNTSQALSEIDTLEIQTQEGIQLINFLKASSVRGITKKGRKPGELKGKIKIADDFDHLPDDISKALEITD